MPEIFNPNSRFGKTFWASFLAVFLLGITVFALRTVVEPPQPLSFNHLKHRESGLECTDCHSGAREQARATLPEIAACLTCHETPLTDSAEETKIQAAAARGTGLVWTQVTRMPAHVYFSHRRHVLWAKLDCADCHGAIGESTTPPKRPPMPLTMDACMDCHSRSRARNDCNDCHR